MRRLIQTISDAQRLEGFLAHATDEFPAHAMPRVSGGLVQRHRHSTGLQRDAQRKPGQPSSRDGDGVFQPREATSLNDPRQWDNSRICHFFESNPKSTGNSP